VQRTSGMCFPSLCPPLASRLVSLPLLPAALSQDVMAYLRLAVGLRDDVALARVINTPRRGVGDASLERLAAAAAAQGGTLCTLLFGDLAAGGSLPPLPDRKALGLTPKSAAALEAFRELVAGLAAGVRGQPLGQALEQIIAQVGRRGLLACMLNEGEQLAGGTAGEPRQSPATASHPLLPFPRIVAPPAPHADRLPPARAGGRLRQRHRQGGGRAGAAAAAGPAGGGGDGLRPRGAVGGGGPG
jgi:hypothetical protein